MAPLEWLLHRLWGPEHNPSYQSGALALLFCSVACLSGIALVPFYKVSTPYSSVLALQFHWAGAWLRALHRYSSDLAMAAILVHIARMFVAGRSWGVRTRAWISGVPLTALFLLVGCTGLVLVWDGQAQRIALAAVRFLDSLPLFSERPARIFAENSLVGDAFFFTLMFVHLALPLGIAFATWFHTSRLAGPRFFPSRSLCMHYGVALAALSALLPLRLAGPADLLQLPGRTPLDWWYAFWVPSTESWGAGQTLALLTVPTLVLTLVPWWSRPPAPPEPSQVDENLCTGCTQCVQDCPFDALSMVKRSEPAEGRSEWVAQVDADRCASCGLCAGSCAPMGVGPPLRTGRDQLRSLEEELRAAPLQPQELVVLACAAGCGGSPRWGGLPGIRRLSTGCSGSLHTSVIEQLLRRGALGVLVVSCPSRDCSQRLGALWVTLRVYADREAELQARVDRRRVRLLEAPSVGARTAVEQALNFRAELQQLEQADLPPKTEPQCKRIS